MTRTARLGWHWLIGGLIVAAIVVGTIISAGGIAAGLISIGLAANGVASAGVLTTIFAFGAVGASSLYVASAIVAGIGAIETMVFGGSLAEGFQSILDYGETAMWNTVGGAVGGMLGGYLSYKEQIGNSSQAGFMNNAQRGAQRKAYWKGKTIDGKAQPGMQISHIYGTYGNNRNFYQIVDASTHKKFHAIYGYKTSGTYFNRTNPNFIGGK